MNLPFPPSPSPLRALAAVGVFLLLAAFSPLGAQPAPTELTPFTEGHPNYYPGTPLNVVNTQPRPGTFYYNDFNRLLWLGFTENDGRHDVQVFGYREVGSATSARNFSGVAIIGHERGGFYVGNPDFLRPNTGNNNPYQQRNLSGNNPNDLSHAFPLNHPGYTGGELVIEPSTFGTGSNNVGFVISTVGYTGITVSFDLTVANAQSSAYYRVRASPDRGATWTYERSDLLIDLTSNPLWYQVTLDFTAHPEFENNPNFIIQFDRIASPWTGQWTNIAGTVFANASSVDIGLNFDRVNYTGTAMPPTATPLELWRDTHFGSTANAEGGADASDPDGDGLPNLLEYALGRLPLTADGAGAVSAALTGDGLRLALTFARIADPSLTYRVEAKDDLASTVAWSTVWSSTGATNAVGTVTVEDTELIADHPRRFLRLRIESSP